MSPEKRVEYNKGGQKEGKREEGRREKEGRRRQEEGIAQGKREEGGRRGSWEEEGRERTSCPLGFCSACLVFRRKGS